MCILLGTLGSLGSIAHIAYKAARSNEPASMLITMIGRNIYYDWFCARFALPGTRVCGTLHVHDHDHDRRGWPYVRVLVKRVQSN